MREREKLPRSFWWLNATQFLGAMNDNVFKLLLVFLAVSLLGTERQTEIVAYASLVFVLPFLLFSHAAGVMTDRVSRRNVVVFAKFLELAFMALGCVAIYLRSPAALYVVLFLMCTQSTIFGPAKYGIIPELVKDWQLSKANSLLVGLSYLAIIIGTFLPSFLLLEVFSGNHLLLGLFCVAVAAIGFTTSLGIRRTPPGGSTKKPSWLFFVAPFRTIWGIRKDRFLLLAVLGSSYFLFLGGFIQQNALLYGHDFLGMSLEQSGYLFPVAALGIGIGALLAGRWSGRNIEFGIVPVGAIGLTLTCVLLGTVQPSLKKALTIIFFSGVSSGLYVVPLQAFIQHRTPTAIRGQVLASTSFFSFLGVGLSAGLLLLLNKGLGLSPAHCFLVIGLLTGFLAVVAMKVLPDFLLRFVVVLITRALYRIRIKGLEHIPVDGPALLVSNHVTWVDAVLLAATQQRRIRFVMSRHVYEHSWMKPLFRIMRVILIAENDPPRRIMASIKEARGVLQEGYLVCIFAEGHLTKNGNLQAFKPGFEKIAKGTNAPIIPVYIDGAWGSIFSHIHGKLLTAWPRRIPYPINIAFGPPLPHTATAAQARLAVLETSCAAFAMRRSLHRSLPHRVIRTARTNWFRPAIQDTTGKDLTFGGMLTGGILLRDQLRPLLKDDAYAGIMLPASVGGALANIAVSLSGSVPVNLNFTASGEALQSAINQCGIRTIVTSRAFLKKLKGLPELDGLVYLEDVLPRARPIDKVRALVKAMLFPIRWLMPTLPAPDDAATVIFSSGSTGIPKGVMLSHHNILSNIESFGAVIRFTRRDRMCAVLPMFHSFGYTVTLWCPLVTGFRTVYHPNPLDGGVVADLVRKHALTILLATPTFLLAYVRKAGKDDFASLRTVVTGAEKLTSRQAKAFEDKFGIRAEEGYGTTELSPAASVNIPDVEIAGVFQAGSKNESIGHPLPGIAMKVVGPDSDDPLPNGQEGILMVKGPNVMLGYLGNEEKTREVLRGGWYDTGDIATIDDDGFVTICGRASRFSKIAGEMVPHVAIEEAIHAALNAISQVAVVTSAPDPKRGEQLVLCYTDEAGDPDALREVISGLDLPNLWKPRKENMLHMETLPKLGSGKLDLKKLTTVARDFVERRPSAIERSINKIRESL